MGLRAGMIGCGAIAEEHLKAIARLEGLEVVAYCDIDLSRAERMLQAYGGSHAVDDPARIFADDGIDVVYICTHHDSHVPLALAACEAGRHVMMEKPLALTIEGCRLIGEAVERSGITLMTAFKLRYYPLVERARAFLPSPTIVMAQVLDARWPDDFWAQHPILGGGNVLSQGCHAMDLLCHLNGSEPDTIFAEGGTMNHDEGSVIDTVAATVRFVDGRIGSVVIADAGRTPYVSKFSFQLVGGGKSVHLHDRLRAAHFFDGEKVEEIRVEEEEGMVEENRELIDALTTGRAPRTGYRDGLRATTMVISAFESARTGLPQRIVQ